MKKSNHTHISAGLRRSIDRSNAIITVSEFTKRELHESMGVPEEKIEIVYSAPATHDNVSTDFSSVALKYGINREYILFVGTIEPRKNISRLLRAFDHLKIEKKSRSYLCWWAEMAGKIRRYIKNSHV